MKKICAQQGGAANEGAAASYEAAASKGWSLDCSSREVYHKLESACTAYASPREISRERSIKMLACIKELAESAELWADLDESILCDRLATSRVASLMHAWLGGLSPPPRCMTAKEDAADVGRRGEAPGYICLQVACASSAYCSQFHMCRHESACAHRRSTFVAALFASITAARLLAAAPGLGREPLGSAVRTAAPLACTMTPRWAGQLSRRCRPHASSTSARRLAARRSCSAPACASEPSMRAASALVGCLLPSSCPRSRAARFVSTTRACGRWLPAHAHEWDGRAADALRDARLCRLRRRLTGCLPTAPRLSTVL